MFRHDSIFENIGVIHRCYQCKMIAENDIITSSEVEFLQHLEFLGTLDLVIRSTVV